MPSPYCTAYCNVKYCIFVLFISGGNVTPLLSQSVLPASGAYGDGPSLTRGGALSRTGGRSSSYDSRPPAKMMRYDDMGLLAYVSFFLAIFDPLHLCCIAHLWHNCHLSSVCPLRMHCG